MMGDDWEADDPDFDWDDWYWERTQLAREDERGRSFYNPPPAPKREDEGPVCSECGTGCPRPGHDRCWVCYEALDREVREGLYELGRMLKRYAPFSEYLVANGIAT